MAVFLSLQMGSPFIHPLLILKIMTRKEILDWIRIYQDQPFGPEREDERAELVSWYSISAGTGGKELRGLMDYFRRDHENAESESDMRKAREVAQAKNKARKKLLEEKKKKQQESIQKQTQNLRPTTPD